MINTFSISEKHRKTIKICTKRLHTQAGTIEPNQAVIITSKYCTRTGFYSHNISPYTQPQKTYAHLLKHTRDLHFRSLYAHEWVCTCCGRVKNTNANTIITKAGREICVDCDLGFHGAKTWLQQIKKALRPEGFSNVILENGGVRHENENK